MILAIDIGNTNITCGVFENDLLVKKSHFCSDIHQDVHFYENLFVKEFSGLNIKDCIISSVVEELTPVIKRTTEKHLPQKAMIVNSKTNFGIGLAETYKKKVGADRMVNVYAAGNMYSKPAIVVDLGTATTFDIVNRNSDFLGGIISAGVGLQLKALALYTSKLPEVNIERVGNLSDTIQLGTETSIISGVVKGHAYAIEGLLADCVHELGEKPVIVATGGYANLISGYMKNYKFEYINPNLTLEGLNLLYRSNAAVRE